MAEKKVISGKGKSISILILGDISAWYGANSKILYDTLRNKEVENIRLYISSDGGNLSEALVMYDMLKGHRAKVTGYLTGMVASAATVVACACDEVKISKQAVYMVHRAATIIYGNANDLKKTVSVLELFDNKLVDIYAQFASIRKKDLRKKLLWELIDNEYFTDQAGVMEMGLADEVIEHVEFDFDTEEMDWRYYSSGEQVDDRGQLLADPQNMAKHGAYFSTMLQVKGYQFLTLTAIKNKFEMKSMKSVFASLVAFLGVQGFLKDGAIEDAKTAAESFDVGNEIEGFLQSEVNDYLVATRDMTQQMEATMNAQIAAINTRMDELSAMNEGLVAKNQALQAEMETEKNTGAALYKALTAELALVKNMKSVSTGNGESPALPVAPIGNSISDDERVFYGAAVKRGNITKEQYKVITGMEFE